MKTTIKDIAEYCKISVGTVDRALNNRVGISEKTKKKILEAAELLNYHPNHTGRSLAKGRTMTIGVVCFDLYNNFFPELIDTIESQAKQRGYFIHLILTHRDLWLEEDGLNYLCERQVDGIILFPIGLGADYMKFLKGLGIPIVTIYNKLDDSFPFVSVDDKAAMADAVKHIAQKGYENVIYLTPDMQQQKRDGLNIYTLQQRMQGYMDGMKKTGLEQPLILGTGSMEEKIDYILEHDKLNGKTALLCLCDSYAIKALYYLRKRGIQIPEQLGLMGYDDIEPVQYIEPRLSTIKYSVLKMGEVAIDMLFQCIEDHTCNTQYLLGYKIVEGKSL